LLYNNKAHRQKQELFSQNKNPRGLSLGPTVHNNTQEDQNEDFVMRFRMRIGEWIKSRSHGSQP